MQSHTQTDRQADTTSGSLTAQLTNAGPRVLGRRMDGQGCEAVGVASITVQAWRPDRTAALRLVAECLRGQLVPGAEADAERATQALARNVRLTRQAIRDAVVRPLVEPALRDIASIRARNVAGLTPENARPTVDGIVRHTLERIDLTAAQVKSEVGLCFGPERLLKSIDTAIADSDESLSNLLVGLERIRDRSLAEGESIDRDMAKAVAQMEAEREQLHVIATGVSKTWFGRSRQLDTLTAEIQTTIPKIGNGRLAALYLPAVRDGLPARIQALEDRIAVLHERRDALRHALDAVEGISREDRSTANESGRLILVGQPRSAAAIAAEVERLMNASRPAIARELRDLAVCKAPAESIIAAVLAVANQAVAAHAPPKSLDDALFTGTAPAAVARELDAIIEGVAIPVAVGPNADRAFFRDCRALVMRVPRNSRIPEVLREHVHYPPDRFCYGERPDRMEIILVQAGIDLKDTVVLQSGRSWYDDEAADRSSPPVNVYTDAFLKNLARRSNGKGESPVVAPETWTV
ncbi:MAG: hypothetical protein JXQ75_01110 [Phycisphaerae bacterium]|nr:hypothetical protein [Phycisphaerae bacterium]